MRIAVASDGFEVSPHFGRCTNYNFYTVINGEITDYQNMPNTEQLCAGIVPLMKEFEVRIVITGNIGANTREAFVREGIIVISGVNGEARQAVDDCVNGKFDYEKKLPRGFTSR